MTVRESFAATRDGSQYTYRVDIPQDAVALDLPAVPDGRQGWVLPSGIGVIVEVIPLSEPDAMAVERVIGAIIHEYRSSADLTVEGASRLRVAGASAALAYLVDVESSDGAPFRRIIAGAQPTGGDRAVVVLQIAWQITDVARGSDVPAEVDAVMRSWAVGIEASDVVEPERRSTRDTQS